MVVFKLSPSGSQLSLEFEAKIVFLKVVPHDAKSFLKRGYFHQNRRKLIFVSFPNLWDCETVCQDGGKICVSNIVLIDDFHWSLIVVKAGEQS